MMLFAHLWDQPQLDAPYERLNPTQHQHCPEEKDLLVAGSDSYPAAPCSPVVAVALLPSKIL